MARRVPSALRRMATNWAGQLTQIAREFAPPHLKGYIHSKVEERGDDFYTIILSVKKVEGPPHEGSMDAAAQEYGSGEHDEQGPHRIPIVPKNGKYLVFKWDKVDYHDFPHTPDGKVMLTHVEHPGIRPYQGIGYLRPAIQELKAKGTRQLSESVRQAILGDLAESFKHANKR